jgi:hypothetical protein
VLRFGGHPKAHVLEAGVVVRDGEGGDPWEVVKSLGCVLPFMEQLSWDP